MIKLRLSLIALGTLIGLVSQGYSQTMTVSLDTLSVLEGMNHFELCSSTPPSGVVLPHVDLSKAQFVKSFYSWSQTDHPSINIMVLPDTSGEWMYVDRNYNRDLSDDGPPELYRFDQPTFTFDIVSRTDTLQRTRLLLARRLNYMNLPDTTLNGIVDPEGNMRPRYVNSWVMVSGVKSFKGSFGTFYWDNRISVRSGFLPGGPQITRLGVWDYDNNGIFNDSVDQILVATGPDEYLSESDPTRVFLATDVIPILGSHWKLTTLDRYGRTLALEKTDLPLTGMHRAAPDTSTNNYEVDEAVWTLKLTDLDGQTVSLDQLRGNTILLNFWGEWCKPCLAELPELVETATLQTTHSGFRVVSILSMGNRDKATSIIRDRGISWPQYLETPEIAKLFKLSQYPTNYLLFPDGRNALLLHSVDSGLVSKRVE